MDTNWMLKKEFYIEKGRESNWIKSCAILPNGKLLFVDQGNNRLLVHNHTGAFEREVHLSYTPFDIAVLNPEMYAITYGKYRTLQIFDMNEHSLCHDMKFAKSCWGVAYADGRLYVCVFERGIEVYTLDGTQIKTISAQVLVEKGCYCSVDGDRIFYTANFWGEVHCCDLNGNAIWQFRDDLLRSPSNVACVTGGDIYVVGYESHNVVSISKDGRKRKVILRQSDGLNYPEAIFYDKARQCLLVANSWGGKAIMYNII